MLTENEILKSTTNKTKPSSVLVPVLLSISQSKWFTLLTDYAADGQAYALEPIHSIFTYNISIWRIKATSNMQYTE